MQDKNAAACLVLLRCAVTGSLMVAGQTKTCFSDLAYLNPELRQAKCFNVFH